MAQNCVTRSGTLGLLLHLRTLPDRGIALELALHVVPVGHLCRFLLLLGPPAVARYRCSSFAKSLFLGGGNFFFD